jgi:hypothetical protein
LKDTPEDKRCFMSQRLPSALHFSPEKDAPAGRERTWENINTLTGSNEKDSDHFDDLKE